MSSDVHISKLVNHIKQEQATGEDIQAWTKEHTWNRSKISILSPMETKEGHALQ